MLFGVTFTNCFSGIPKNVFKQGVSKSEGIIEYPIKIDAVT